MQLDASPRAGLADVVQRPGGPVELNLTNYSATNLIQVMPVGDSITDDCVTNGAWREPMQPLLDSNHVPYNCVGRENSSYTLGQAFTKIHHEGYCGAVIAPPGVSAPEPHLHRSGKLSAKYCSRRIGGPHSQHHAGAHRSQ